MHDVGGIETDKVGRDMRTSDLNWRRGAFILGMAGCVQFVLLTIVAMFLYPGGSYSDHDAAGYSFWINFFSDLGRSRTFSEQPNPASMSLFIVALSLASLTLVAAFVAMPRLFARNGTARRLSVAGSVFGVVSAAAYLGIACTPADVNLTVHKLFVQIAFSSFLLVVIMYSAAILRDRGYPKFYAFAYIAFALILAAYLVLLFGGPHIYTPEGVRIQATGQKVVVYAEIGCMFLQSYGAMRVEKQLHQ